MEQYYLGGDASKGYCDFVILDQRKRIVESNFQLDDTYEGHLTLISTIKKLFTKDPTAILYAALESTGGYESNWFNTSFKERNELNIKVARINPFGVKRNLEASLERNKTDKISARAIAEYLIDHPKKVIYNKEDPMASLRKLWSFLSMLTKQKVQLLNQLESALYNSNPHLLIFCKGGFREWVLKVVMKYPTAAKLAGADPVTLAEIPFVTHERAIELIENAKKNIGSDQDEVAEFRVKSLAQEIFHLKELIKEQGEIIVSLCPYKEEIRLLQSFPGIGELSAVGLMMIIGDISRFRAAKNLCAFFGVHPVYRESGDGSFGYYMSKKGSKEARSILFNVAMSAIVHNDMITQLYEGYQKKGKRKMSAIGIMMHKITRIIYGMLKNKRAFDSKVDEVNRKKIVDKKVKIVIKKDRRYQGPDETAPISRRQKKKRKEQEESQNGKTIKCGIITPAHKCTERI